MRFTDEKLQALFEDFLKRAKNMEEVSWYKDDPKLISWKQDRQVAFVNSQDAFISAVEAAIRREGEPCEWEKESIPYIYHADMKFCPLCGRKLEAI